MAFMVEACEKAMDDCIITVHVYGKHLNNRVNRFINMAMTYFYVIDKEYNIIKLSFLTKIYINKLYVLFFMHYIAYIFTTIRSRIL